MWLDPQIGAITTLRGQSTSGNIFWEFMVFTIRSYGSVSVGILRYDFATGEILPDQEKSIVSCTNWDGPNGSIGSVYLFPYHWGIHICRRSYISLIPEIKWVICGAFLLRSQEMSHLEDILLASLIFYAFWKIVSNDLHHTLYIIESLLISNYEGRTRLLSVLVMKRLNYALNVWNLPTIYPSHAVYAPLTYVGFILIDTSP